MATDSDPPKTLKPLFRSIDASESVDDLEISEIESLCMTCGENVNLCVVCIKYV